MLGLRRPAEQFEGKWQGGGTLAVGQEAIGRGGRSIYPSCAGGSYSSSEFRGLAVSLRCRSERWRQMVVSSRSRCPSNTWMVRKSAPASTRCVLKGSLGSWVRIVEGVDPPWSNFPAVRKTRKDADLVGHFVVFDIKSNEARFISYISYEMGTVTVLAVLTHKEYDRGGWKSACNC